MSRNSLRGIQSDAVALQKAVASEQATFKSLDITRKRLQLGDINYLALLNAQQSYQQALISVVQARAARYADTVALFQALGGGWWNGADVDPEKPLTIGDVLPLTGEKKSSILPHADGGNARAYSNPNNLRKSASSARGSGMSWPGAHGRRSRWRRRRTAFPPAACLRTRARCNACAPTRFLRTGIETAAASQECQRVDIAAEVGPLAGAELAIDGDEQRHRRIEELEVRLYCASRPAASSRPIPSAP